MLGISMYWQVGNKIDTINNYQISISVNTNQKIEVNNTTKKQIQWKDKDKKEVCVDKNHKSQKKLKKAYSITHSGHEHKSYSLTHADGTAHEQWRWPQKCARHGWGMSLTYHQSLQTGQP